MDFLGLKGQDFIMDTTIDEIISTYVNHGQKLSYVLEGLKLDLEHLKYSPVLTPTELNDAEKKYNQVIAEIQKMI